MKKLYEQHLLPLAIDYVCGLPSFEQGRRDLVGKATGRVLEIGIGTGRNFSYYQRSQLQSLHGIDPALHRKATQRAQANGLTVTLTPLSAERIAAPDNSFDTVVSTFTLCSINNLSAALAEIQRVLAPNGQFLFLEHGAAPDSAVRSWQNRLTPLWRQCAGGCHLNRNIPALLTQAGFSLSHLSQGYQAGPRILTYLYQGVAVINPS